MGDPLLDTEFRELDNEVWTNADGSKVLRRHTHHNGYDGCSAVNSVANSNCIPGKRWAFINYSYFETGGSPVNIWSKKGTTTGVYQCCKFYKLHFNKYRHHTILDLIE